MMKQILSKTHNQVEAFVNGIGNREESMRQMIEILMETHFLLLCRMDRALSVPVENGSCCYLTVTPGRGFFTSLQKN